jgi:hypothetical protein
MYYGARQAMRSRTAYTPGWRGSFQNRAPLVATFAGAKTMLWIVWALLLVSHGAVSRWAQTADSYAKASVLGDVLLMAVALITLDQLQGLGFAEVLRIGLFFTAFGWAGRQLMGSVLKSSMT